MSRLDAVLKPLAAQNLGSFHYQRRLDQSIKVRRFDNWRSFGPGVKFAQYDTESREENMGLDQDGRHAARILALATGILFTIVLVLNAVTF